MYDGTGTATCTAVPVPVGSQSYPTAVPVGSYLAIYRHRVGIPTPPMPSLKVTALRHERTANTFYGYRYRYGFVLELDLVTAGQVFVTSHFCSVSALFLLCFCSDCWKLKIETATLECALHAYMVTLALENIRHNSANVVFALIVRAFAIFHASSLCSCSALARPAQTKFAVLLVCVLDTS